MRLTTTILLICAAACVAGADTLTLRSGQTVQGTFLGGTSRQVRIEVDGNVQTYDVSMVKTLAFTDSAPIQATAAPSPSAAVPATASRPEALAVTASGATIPVGTAITVRMVDAVNSETTRLGQTFMASLDEPIVVDGRTVLPRGADVMTKLVDDQKAGKLTGHAVQTLALVSINAGGRWVELSSADVRTESGSQTAKTAKVVGGTAAVGAIIGGIVGGGKGAAIGAGSGAAVGTGATVMTSGQKVVIPSETRLTFHLQSPAQL
jgi:hypothetical protein